MATVSIDGIGIKGIACCAPKDVQRISDITTMSVEEIQKFIEVTGVEERRIATETICTSDLCVQASEELFKALDWERESIEILVFVSQTGDYVLPVTSAILQDRLQLPKTCMAFDIPLGCSGYVYGISVITGLMKSFGFKRGLLLTGDTISKLVSKTDKSTFPLFGDAASATAFELEDEAGEILFDLGTDGSGFQSIMIPYGGSRNKATIESMDVHTIEEGISRDQCQLNLDGMDVFSFGISQAPKTVLNLLNAFKIDKDKVDFFVFHQANLMMNKMIAKKLKLPNEKVPYSLMKYGNTSSATIPLTIVTELKEKMNIKNSNLILCGFGVGLSWGTIHLTINADVKLIFSDYE